MSMLNLISKHVPEWIEAGVVLGVLFVGAISAASVTLYKVDLMSQDVADIKHIIKDVPVLIEKIDNLKEDTVVLQEDVSNIEDDIRELEKNSG